VSNALLISIDVVPASDSWGFVGRVLVGEVEAYRTIRAHPSPAEAATATTQLLAGVLGPMLAGQEWHDATDEFGHAPRRLELGLGLTGLRDHRDGRGDAIDDSAPSP
jgi:hypothetical protein